jgi:hypothetical protein
MAGIAVWEIQRCLRERVPNDKLGVDWIVRRNGSSQ